MYINSFVALLAATAVSAAPAAKVTREDGQWQLQRLNTHTPSGRPGNSPYSLLNATIQSTDGNSTSTGYCNLQYLNNDDAPWGVELPCTTDEGDKDTWAFTLEEPEGGDGDASTNFDLSFKVRASYKSTNIREACKLTFCSGLLLRIHTQAEITSRLGIT